jgi:hypothetical protein
MVEVASLKAKNEELLERIHRSYASFRLPASSICPLHSCDQSLRHSPSCAVPSVLLDTRHETSMYGCREKCLKCLTRRNAWQV